MWQLHFLRISQFFDFELAIAFMAVAYADACMNRASVIDWLCQCKTKIIFWNINRTNFPSIQLDKYQQRDNFLWEMHNSIGEMLNFNIKIQRFNIIIANFNTILLNFNIKIPHFKPIIANFNIIMLRFNIKIVRFNIKIQRFNVIINNFNIKSDYFKFITMSN